MPLLLKNMFAENLIDEAFLSRLNEFLKRMRGVDSKYLCKKEVANFLMMTIHCIEELEQRMEDSSDY